MTTTIRKTKTPTLGLQRTMKVRSHEGMVKTAPNNGETGSQKSLVMMMMMMMTVDLHITSEDGSLAKV